MNVVVSQKYNNQPCQFNRYYIILVCYWKYSAIVFIFINTCPIPADCCVYSFNLAAASPLPFPVVDCCVAVLPLSVIPIDCCVICLASYWPKQ